MFLSIVTLDLFRNTFSRVLTLMVALGFQIVIKNVHKYANKITVLCVVLMLSMVLSFTAQERSKEHPMLPTVVGLAHLPLLLTDLLLFFWIFLAFRRTLQYLGKKHQDYKYNIISKIYKAFVACIAIGAFLAFIELVIQRNGANKDKYWKSAAYWETYSFVLFTVFISVLMLVLQPEDNSHKLCDIDELVDETLQTEIPSACDDGKQPQMPQAEDIYNIGVEEQKDPVDELELHEFAEIK